MSNFTSMNDVIALLQLMPDIQRQELPNRALKFCSRQRIPAQDKLAVRDALVRVIQNSKCDLLHQATLLARTFGAHNSYGGWAGVKWQSAITPARVTSTLIATAHGELFRNARAVSYSVDWAVAYASPAAALRAVHLLPEGTPCRRKVQITVCVAALIELRNAVAGAFRTYGGNTKTGTLQAWSNDKYLPMLNTAIAQLRLK